VSVYKELKKWVSGRMDKDVKARYILIQENAPHMQEVGM
jgi:hypothetical protein